jgi:uncharacterized protein with NRDE domain
MCLALLALNAHPQFALVIAANRDEHHARPAAPAAWWKEGWLAGRDLSAGGSWLAVRRDGRYALLTNIREPERRDPAAPSRGALVTRVVADVVAPAASLASVLADGAAYNGFNLIAGDTASSHWISNRTSAVLALTSGIHGISNAALDTPWPKVVRSTSALRAWCERSGDDVETLFAVLSDRTRAADGDLPATGVAIEWERRLSASFIVAEESGYGTRCSTIVVLGRNGRSRFIERTFDSSGRYVGEVDIRFTLSPRA